MANLPQYPAPPGNLNQVVATIKGPSSYAAITTGSPPTGGIAVTAAQLGLTSLHWVEGGCSDDGQYGLEPIFPNNPAADASSVIFAAYVLATGAAVTGTTDLSARTFRIWAFGF